MTALWFISGFLLCALLAWCQQREKQKEHNRLYCDFLKLVNELSLRNGGRAIFKDKKPEVASSPSQPPLDRGEFRILTPSMALAEAEDEPDEATTLDDVDMEHLRRTGVIN